MDFSEEVVFGKVLKEGRTEHTLWIAEWEHVLGRGDSRCEGPDTPALFQCGWRGSE